MARGQDLVVVVIVAEVAERNGATRAVTFCPARRFPSLEVVSNDLGDAFDNVVEHRLLRRVARVCR